MELNALQQYDANRLLKHEWLVGIDEAGRGALAGPVVAGACVIGKAFFESSEAVELSVGINDSKQLSARDRETMLERIDSFQRTGLIDIAVSSASVREIDALNILGATRLAMRRALEVLSARALVWSLPESAEDGPLFAAERNVELIVDGRPLKPFPYAHEGVVKGDAKSLAIAMASIAAKVTRDRELVRCASEYPAYGFAGHKGYGTQAHREAILAHGGCPIHRPLFLRKIVSGLSNPGAS